MTCPFSKDNSGQIRTNFSPPALNWLLLPVQMIWSSSTPVSYPPTISSCSIACILAFKTDYQQLQDCTTNHQQLHIQLHIHCTSWSRRYIFFILEVVTSSSFNKLSIWLMDIRHSETVLLLHMEPLVVFSSVTDMELVMLISASCSITFFLVITTTSSVNCILYADYDKVYQSHYYSSSLS